MEITANLLKLANEWIIAQVEPAEGDTIAGDPDVWMIEPYVVDCEGQIVPWATHASEREFNVRSSDITVVTNPSKSLLARYIESLE
jgi:sulfur carrier protein ThiS